jgi:hypothetical protein
VFEEFAGERHYSKLAWLEKRGIIDKNEISEVYTQLTQIFVRYKWLLESDNLTVQDIADISIL